MGTQPQAAPSDQSASFVARQPILTEDQQVLGYELSFQPSPQATSPASVGKSEASAIIETLNVIGLNVLCDGRRAFIDCTHEML